MFLDFLFPRECVGCGKEWNYLCSDCKKQLYAHPEICPLCHKDSKDFRICFWCRAKEDSLEGIIIGFSYKSLLKKLILKVKFGHKKDIVDFLAERLSLLMLTNENLSSLVETHQLFISFVPSHWKRKYLEKWYNQSELLAKALANQLWLPMISVAKKLKYTVSQLKLSKTERAKNLNEVFVIQDVEQLSQWSTILVVDDVTTTGSTLLELAKVIKKERSDVKIRGAVLARNMH